jgi:hypothetical protein
LLIVAISLHHNTPYLENSEWRRLRLAQFKGAEPE